MVDQPSKFSGQWGWGLYVALHSLITPPIVPLDHSIVLPSILQLQISIFYLHDFFFMLVTERIKVCSKLLDTSFWSVQIFTHYWTFTTELWSTAFQSCLFIFSSDWTTVLVIVMTHPEKPIMPADSVGRWSFKHVIESMSGAQLGLWELERNILTKQTLF